MCFFGFELNVPCLSPVVKMDYLILGVVMLYLVYISVRDCNHSIICVDCCVSMRANGSGDIPGVVVPYDRG